VAGLAFALDAGLDAVDAVLTLGERRDCLSFGGSVSVREGRRLVATDAPRATACPPSQ